MRDLTKRPLDEFAQVDVADMGTYHTLRATRTVAERERTVVVLDSPTLREGQLRGLGQTLMRPVGALAKLAHRLCGSRRCKRARLENQVKRIVRTADAARSILRWEIADAGDGHWTLDRWIDEDAYTHLRDRQYGRRLLVTDRAEWSTSSILAAYWGGKRGGPRLRDAQRPAPLRHPHPAPLDHPETRRSYLHGGACIYVHGADPEARTNARLRGEAVRSSATEGPPFHRPPRIRKPARISSKPVASPAMSSSLPRNTTA
jgi:hypothetical protein